VYNIATYNREEIVQLLLLTLRFTHR